MSTTLLIEKNNELAMFYKLILRTWVDINAVHANTVEQAYKYISENGVVDLLIIRENHKTKKIFKSLRDQFKNNHIDKVPTIVLGEETENEANVKYISNGLNHKDLIKACASALGITPQMMADLEVPEHFAIKTHYLKYIESPPCDLYTAPQKIICKAESKLSKKIADETAQDFKDFLVNKNHRLEIVKHITSSLIETIDPGILTKNETITYSEMSFNNLADHMKNFGMTEESIDLSKKAMKNMINVSKSNPTMGKLVKRLLQNNTGYLFKHTQVLMFITTHLMDHIDWGSDDQKEKIHFVSFFHDIALATDEQAKISSEIELKKSTLDKKEKDLVNKHAQKAAELIKNFPSAPMGVDIIIRQHHGVAHGVGFSEHYSGNISPLAIVFILAEDFTRSLLELNEEFDPQIKIEQMRKRYSTQRFIKIIDLFEKII